MSEPTWSERYGLIVAQNRRKLRLSQQALAGIAHVEVETVQLIEAGGIAYVEEERAYLIQSAPRTE